MSKNSFLFGIMIASFAWALSLYIYMQILQSSEKAAHIPFSQSRKTKIKYSNNDVLNDISDSTIDYKKYKYKNKESYDKQENFKKFINSKQLIKNLQPIAPKSSVTLGFGLDELGMVRTSEDQVKRDEGYKSFAFNVLVSDALGYKRNIPETRHKLCKNQTYPANLPKASVIVCFYNEHVTTLLRTIHSILDRTSKSLLHEILLIDDYSDIPTLYAQVKNYIEENLDNRVQIYKTQRREGLIRARMFGADRATGEVIVFLDSHVEVNVNWLEPLLAVISTNHTKVVMPVIDIINADTFAYTSSPLVRGGFNWGLHFKWDNLPKGTLEKDEDFIKPIKSPTMAGGLFAINREYFNKLGKYDPGMNIWGGENLEISFRIWMCGGSLALIPCSRVGHVFRKRRPYGDPNGEDTMLHNSLRVAHVWMDDYKENFFKQHKSAAKTSYGDISERLKLRKQLHCHNFEWYLKNIYPEMVLPSDDEVRLKKKWSAVERNQFLPWHLRKRNYVDSFKLRMSNTNLCIQSVKEVDVKSKGSLLVLKECSDSKSQIWSETDKNELVLAQLLCLQANSPSPYLMKCHEMGGDQEWRHNEKDQSPIYNMAAGTCLGVQKAVAGASVTMELCSIPDRIQWDLIR